MSVTKRPYDLIKTYEVMEAEDTIGGKALVAVKLISAGTCIKSSPYFFAADKDIILEKNFVVGTEIKLQQRIDVECSAEEINSYLKMAPKYFHCKGEGNADLMAVYLGRFRGLALPLNTNPQYGSSSAVGVFLELSYLNHSCNPNAQLTFDEESNIATLYTLREIQNQEEITISYLPEASVDIRKLGHLFDFECGCDWCERPNNAKKRASVQKRRDIDQLLQDMEILSKTENQAEVLKLGWRLTCLLREEKINDWKIGRCYELLYDVCERVGGTERAKWFAILGIQSYSLCEGSGGMSVRRLRQKAASMLHDASHSKGDVLEVSIWLFDL